MKHAIKHYKNVSEFADKYEGFILDIWGVIHDGYAAYPGVLETIQKLKEKGKKIVFLSNAPRRASKVKQVLAKFGITEDLYLDATSSGEVAYEIIKNTESGNYFYIGPEKDRDLLDGLNLKQTSAEEAGFAITTGFDHDHSTFTEKLPDIEAAFKKHLKLYCVNPDRIVVRQNGAEMLCAGVIGEYYEEMGGKVIFIGKPYKQVYEKALELLNLPKDKIAAIGDNLDTDIVGANNFGIDSILALGGVLKSEKRHVNEVMEEVGIWPHASVPAFIWS